MSHRYQPICAAEQQKTFRFVLPEIFLPKMLLLLLGLAFYFFVSVSEASLPKLQAKLQDEAFAPHIKVEMISEHAFISLENPFWVAIHFTPEQDWHTYWQNPGDSGITPTIDWDLPQGFVAGQIHWGFPEAINVSGIINLGYHHENTLLVPISAPRSLTDEIVHLKAHVKWLVCKESCIPGEAHLALSLPVLQSSDNASSAQSDQHPLNQQALKIFEKARRQLPAPLEIPAFYDVKDETLNARFS